MQEIGEQLDSAILAYAILLQLMHCSIASCVLHIACCVGVRSPLGATFQKPKQKTSLRNENSLNFGIINSLKLSSDTTRNDLRKNITKLLCMRGQWRLRREILQGPEKNIL